MAGSEAQRSIDVDELDRASVYQLLNSLIVPRAIAWVSTVDADGRANLAPHSYTTIAGVTPPMLLFVSIGEKDTARNVRATGEFVVNLVDEQLAERMNVTAAKSPHGVSEFELAGLTAAACDRVAPLRVAQAPGAIECRLHEVVALGNEPSLVIIGEVVRIHIAERIVGANGRVDQGRIGSVARMGGNVYARTSDRFEMVRPAYEDVLAGLGAKGAS